MRALSITEVLRQKKEVFPFEGAWLEAFGRPETKGVWIIWGGSGNGKSSFVMQLVRELARWRRVAYVSLEEGTSLTLQQSLERHAMQTVTHRVQILQDTMPELRVRLRQRGSAEVVVIDSFQYTQMTYKDYLQFRRIFAGKLLIFVSHAEGKEPAGKSAKSVRYDATMKIRVEGFRAFSGGRFYGTRGWYDIWPERSAQLWGEVGKEKGK